jgi:uncharacterized ferritin-like protein (DUF455 family)
MDSENSLAIAAVDILTTADPLLKVSKTFRYAATWNGADLPVGHCPPPRRPSRPQAPVLCAPSAMPKRSTGPKGRIALVHALAHIELNAIDLAWDIVARFTSNNLPTDFYNDWVEVADEEAKHFQALVQRLTSWDVVYGDLPAHDGLWEAADITAESLPARLALIPMTLEARGIDTTPKTSQRLRQADDAKTADILDMIYEDEIKHLSIGIRWFEFLCAKEGTEPTLEYKYLLDKYFRGTPKGPFNIEARESAGMGPGYLEHWP